MPLRDHFHQPLSTKNSWEGFHGMLPGAMVMQLSRSLPKGYTAEPRVHLGTYYEIDVCTFADEPRVPARANRNGNGGTATWAPPKPTVAVDVEIPDQYEYEVLIFDLTEGRHLVAAVEIVSPANKDRPASRRTFVAKCATMIQKRVCVSIVDLVTTRRFNLYTDLLDLLGCTDPTFSPKPPPLYAATCRHHQVIEEREKRFVEFPRFETWSYPMALGKRLPKLPIWLSDEQGVTLDLEASYEEACKALRIR